MSERKCFVLLNTVTNIGVVWYITTDNAIDNRQRYRYSKRLSIDNYR